jgi:hypothetical protein
MTFATSSGGTALAATDREQIYEALRRADAAGDTAAAQRLAEYIATLPSDDYQVPRRQGEIEKAARAVGSKVAETVGGAAQWARDAYRGPGDLPELPEFNAPAPTGSGTAAAAFGLMMSNNPAAHVDILKKQYPGIQFENVTSEEGGGDYAIASWTDPQGQQHRGYINAPGMTGRDWAAMGGQAAAYMPAARFGQGASMLTGAAKRAVPGLIGRMGRTGVATAATRAGLDKAVEPLGSEQGIDPAEVAVTGAAGAAAEVAAPLVSGAYRVLRGNPLRAGDGLSSQGERLAAEAGLDTANMPPRALNEFARIAEGGDTVTAGRAAELAEFNIPATRGQVSQSYPQLNLEERMRRGLEGPEAESILKGMDARQTQSIDDAVGQVQGRLQPRPSGDVPEAQSRFLSGVQGAERAAGQRVDDAYGALRSFDNTGVPVPPANALTKRLTDALAESDRFADPGLTPATVRALKEVNERLGDGGVTLADFEKARRVIMSAQRTAPNPEDAANVRILKRELDKWLDETVDAGLMSGDPAAVEALKKARAANTEYMRAFTAKDKNDVAGAIVQRIVEKAETPEMAMNYLFGQGSLAGRAEATGATRRLKEILGPDSDGWNAVREAAWNRLARDTQGKARSPAMFNKEWNNFSLRNRSLRDELFSSEEIALMNRYRQALGRTDRPPTNPSGSAFSIEEMFRYMLRRMGTAATFQGNTSRGAILHALAKSPFNVFGAADYAKRIAAARALSPVPAGPRPLTAPVAAGTAAIDQMQR